MTPIISNFIAMESIKRAIVTALVFLVPVLITNFSQYTNLTLGAILMAILHFAEASVGGKGLLVKRE